MIFSSLVRSRQNPFKHHSVKTRSRVSEEHYVLSVGGVSLGVPRRRAGSQSHLEFDIKRAGCRVVA